MGAVDLVIQVESPKSVSRGLQRIGRAGHGVGERSKGRIFPKFRADLLECAVVARLMREGRIEPTVVPRNALDVLAQQIVAIAAAAGEDETGRRRRAVRARHAHALLRRAAARAARERARHARRPLPVGGVRRAAPADRVGSRRRDDPRAQGRRPPGDHERGHDPRPRPLRRRPAGRAPRRRARRGDGLRGAAGPDVPARRLDLADRGDRPRPRDRHARRRARPGAVPFWKGDGVGRPKELGDRDRRVRADGARACRPQELAARVRPRPARDPQPARVTCASSRTPRASSRATARSSSSASATRSATGGCACSRPTAAACTPPGRSRCRARLRDELGLESDAIWSDEGIIVHLPDADEPPGADTVLLDPETIEDQVVAELGASALFGARFRENAARALLIPRAYPGRRTPLWQQRLKAQSLLEVAKRYADFPIILETYRECLRDVLDVPGLQELLTKLHTRELSLVEVETPTASPFASALLFDYVATYMYEGDTPNAERRAAALSLDRDLLRELLGQEELRELIDPGALDERRGRPAAPLGPHARGVERRARRRAAPRRRPDRALRRRSACSPGSTPPRFLDTLRRERRAVVVRVGGEERWIAADDAGLYRDAVGVVPPGGLPEAFLDRAPSARSRSCCAATRARTGRSRPTRSARATASTSRARSRRWRPRGELVRGELRPKPRQPEPRVVRSRTCCGGSAARRSPCCARRSRRSTAARSRRSCPAGRASTAIRRPAPASTGCARRSCRCRASRCPPTSGSATCCRAASAPTRRHGWTS